MPLSYLGSGATELLEHFERTFVCSYHQLYGVQGQQPRESAPVQEYTAFLIEAESLPYEMLTK